MGFKDRYLIKQVKMYLMELTLSKRALFPSSFLKAP